MVCCISRPHCTQRRSTDSSSSSGFPYRPNIAASGASLRVHRLLRRPIVTLWRGQGDRRSDRRPLLSLFSNPSFARIAHVQVGHLLPPRALRLATPRLDRSRHVGTTPQSQPSATASLGPVDASVGRADRLLQLVVVLVDFFLRRIFSPPHVSDGRLVHRRADQVGLGSSPLEAGQGLPLCLPRRSGPCGGERAEGACEEGQLGNDEDGGTGRAAHGLEDVAGVCRFRRQVRRLFRTRKWIALTVVSRSLTATFPDDRFNTASPTVLAPPVPRLSKKVSLFVTRSTHVQRQNELDNFCRRLFDMPADVKQSSLVREFFRFRPDDRLGLPASATHSAASSRSALNLPVNLDSAFGAPPGPAWLAAGDPENDLTFADETIKAAKPRTLRPKLAIKISSPNLRGNVRGFGRDDDSSFLSPISGVSNRSGPGLLRHFEPPDALSRAESSFSMATMSSARTITPSPVAPPPIVGGASMAKTIRKKASGGLRHIRSLGDLRSSSKKAAATDEPVPALPTFPSPPPAPTSSASASMERAATQPLPTSRFQPPISSTSNRRPSAGLPSPSARSAYMAQTAPAREAVRHARGSKSSISSFEDLWGTAFPSTFRQTPSGRVECVRTDEFGRPVNGTKRLSGVGVPARTNSFGHASTVRPPMYRHGRQTSTTSISSVDSARSGGSAPSMSMTMSRSRSSGGSEICPTPPTPAMEWSASKSSNEGGPAKDKVIAGKYYVENGVLLENNMVPPPPFFVRSSFPCRAILRELTFATSTCSLSRRRCSSPTRRTDFLIRLARPPRRPTAPRCRTTPASRPANRPRRPLARGRAR